MNELHDKRGEELLSDRLNVRRQPQQDREQLLIDLLELLQPERKKASQN